MRRVAHRETLVSHWSETTYNRQTAVLALIDPSTFPHYCSIPAANGGSLTAI
jgi:hypothetical protein